MQYFTDVALLINNQPTLLQTYVLYKRKFIFTRISRLTVTHVMSGRILIACFSSLYNIS